MALDDKIEAVQKVNKALGKQSTADLQVVERIPPNEEHFQSLIDQNQNVNTQINVKATEEATMTVQKPAVNTTSLMDELKNLNKKVNTISQLSPEDLKNQAQDVIAQIDDVKSKLANAQTEIRPAYHTVLHNRLTHIDDSLKIALSKAGVEYKSPAAGQVTGRVNPIERFMGYLTQGQSQLEQLGTTIEQLSMTKNNLTPANMLAIQMKVGYVQQQLELFTNVLNKALESTKTIMNVQV